MREVAAMMVRRGTVLAVVALCLVVGLVGVVGVLAQLIGTWEWLFRFEGIVAASTPFVLVLVGISLVGAMGVVLLSPTTE